MKGKKNWKVVVLMTAVLLSLTGVQVFASVAPSVSQKAAPVVVGAATFTDANGNAVTIDAGGIIITPDAKKATLSPEGQAVYDKAKTMLIDPASQFPKNLDSFVAANFPGNPAENFIVRDLFNIAVVGQDLAFGQGQKLNVTIDGKYKAGDTIIVTVYNKDTDTWDFVETKDVTVNADGTLTINFPHLGPVAILVLDQSIKTSTTTVENTKKNAVPPTVTGQEGGSGNGSSMLIPVLGVGAVIVAAVVVALKKKKSL